MNKIYKTTIAAFLVTGILQFSTQASAQKADTTLIKNIIAEANNNSQLTKMGHELLDNIGPRLVGTPQMKQAADWAVNTFKSWGINSYTQNWGTWRGWERGITHVDMLSPRVRSLEAMQLAWSGNTNWHGVAIQRAKQLMQK